jgi:hypothetical protein
MDTISYSHFNQRNEQDGYGSWENLKSLVDAINEQFVLLDSSSNISISLEYIDASFYTKAYVDGSLQLRAVKSSMDASIAKLRLYIDGSIYSRAYIDASIAALRARDNILDVSIGVLSLKDIYVDGSLELRAIATSTDGSIADIIALYDACISKFKVYVDASLVNQRASTDASIAKIIAYYDASLVNQRASTDASLVLRAIKSSTDASIARIIAYYDASLVNQRASTDASIGKIIAYMDASYYSKAYVDVSLNLKAVKSSTDASLVLKVSLTYVDASFYSKAYVDASLAKAAHQNLITSGLSDGSGAVGDIVIIDTSMYYKKSPFLWCTWSVTDTSMKL